jgi:carotenoid cleavage dioxygenase-like enzyme
VYVELGAFSPNTTIVPHSLSAPQIDPEVAFRSRLRRIDIDLYTGALRMSKLYDQYLEMPAINDSVSVGSCCSTVLCILKATLCK